MTESSPHSAAAPSPSPKRSLGISGSIARAFIESPLTPLLLIAFFIIGLLGMMVTPREEDPQISVPMVDIFVAYPGASAPEVSHLISEPLERLMSELSGVKHVYSMSREGLSVVTVRFEVGEEMGPSLVKLYNQLYSHMDAIPKGVMQPLVKPKSIDDVPVVTVTLSSGKLGLVQLRKLGLDVLQRFKSLPNTGQGFVVGGSQEQIRVDVDLPRLSAHGVTLGQVAHVISAANQRLPAGDIVEGDKWFNVYSGEFLRNVSDVGNLVIAVSHNRPVFLRDVATITQGASETKHIVDNASRLKDGGFTWNPAVTVAVAKKHGTNGIDVADEVINELHQLKGTLIPDSVRVTLSRNYGKTAQDKVSHLIKKLFIVSALVTVLAFVTMGTRPAIIVMITIPAVLLMSLAVAYVLKFTINRVSMFALVFAIGILVDDAIVVVENIYRRWLESGETTDDITVDAVDEVGNPTILATFTVVAALLPMGFVSGMMGPYMLPIPVLSSSAMIFSLFAAFVFVPWLAARVKPTMEGLKKAEEREHRQVTIVGRVYGGIITPIMDNRVIGWLTLFLIIAAMLGAVSMFLFKSVAFKMLPYDNKSELQVVIDLPAGTDLFYTANVAHRLGTELEKIPEVISFQTYVGASSPFNFNGLVRHYFLRREPWQADIAVQLLDKSKRERSSHQIAIDVRSILTPIARAAGARLTIAETPPGPPVLAPMVIELYGPTAKIRRKVARDLLAILQKTPHLADINTFMQAPHENLQFVVDRQRAAMFGVSVQDINREIAMATGGFQVAALQVPRNLEQAVIVLQTPMATRGNIGNLLVMPVRSNTGALVPLGELGRFVNKPVDPVIYHKDLRPLEYVTADVTGRLGAPLYGMLDVESRLQNYRTPEGHKLVGHFFSPPTRTDVSSFEWEGGWHVTYVTFRDMGLAFMAALVLIYILVVAEFKSFVLPLVVMTPIPLTLIGIVPGHWLLGADFTATSMIGFIALAGIIVRNSILLVQFARERVAEGWTVRDAVITAGRVRLRPILITALALIIGSMVLLDDPIFRGMAVSLLFGSLVATFLTLIVIPLGCVSAGKYFHGSHGGHGVAPPPSGGPTPPPPGGPTPPPPSPPQDGSRPRRLVKKSEAAPGAEASPPQDGAPPAGASAGRPPRLAKKSEVASAPQEAPPPEAETPPQAAPAGRPPRLMKKSEVAPAPEAPPPEAEAPRQAAPAGRPPRLVKKSEVAPAPEAPPPEAEAPPPQEPPPEASPPPAADQAADEGADSAPEAKNPPQDSPSPQDLAPQDLAPEDPAPEDPAPDPPARKNPTPKSPAPNNPTARSAKPARQPRGREITLRGIRLKTDPSDPGAKS